MIFLSLNFSPWIIKKQTSSILGFPFFFKCFLCCYYTWLTLLLAASKSQSGKKKLRINYTSAESYHITVLYFRLENETTLRRDSERTIAGLFWGSRTIVYFRLGNKMTRRRDPGGAGGLRWASGHQQPSGGRAELHISSRPRLKSGHFWDKTETTGRWPQGDETTTLRRISDAPNTPVRLFLVS